MKKSIAIVLTFVIIFSLIPAGTTVKAAELGDKPFYCISMSGTVEAVPYFYYQPCPYVDTVYKTMQWPNVIWGDAKGELEIAAKMKERFDNQPAGTRYFQLELVQKIFRGRAEKVVYFDEAIGLVKDWFTAFLKEYKRLGGQLDGIISDLEYIESHGYYIRDYYRGTRGKTKNINVYKEIVEDPRYATQIRPLLVEYGFKFFEGTDEELGHCEIFCIQSSSGETGHQKCYSIWNHVMDMVERKAINEAVLEPLLEYYPDATLSDYQSATLDTWYEAVDNHGEKAAFNTERVGNLSDTNTYAGRPEKSFFGFGSPVYNNPPSYNKAVFDPSPFNVTNYDINLFKNMYASTDDRRFDAWHSHYYFAADLEASGYGGTYCGTPYYSEVLYHIGLLNPEVFLGYIVASEVKANGGTMEDVAKMVSDIMAELTRVAGASDREPILIPETAAYWNAGYILSGMYAAGRNIWRITPDTDMVSVEDFKIDGKDPTFSVGGLTVTFPQGKIVENGDVHIAGSCGYWVETPKGVNPVVNADPDRYSKYPSYGEDFEGYKAGAAFTSTTALPALCWNVSGTVSVREDSSGKALAVKGTTTIENVSLPANISAGDSYAMQQVWEITATLPDGMNSDAEVILFSSQETDGGIKIADGKVYYDEMGTYKQIEGITLSANTAYTIRREIDFRDYDVFYSDYSVYDAAGNLLGQAKAVPMNAFDLPVAGIKMSTKHLNSVMFLDDYKLYPAGVTTELELYEAEKGTKITALSTVRTENTAYRLSWLNASAEKLYAIVYNTLTGETIQAIEMAPGMDGVNTAVLEITAEKPVALAVKTETSLPPDVDTGNGSQGDGASGGDQGGGNQDGNNQGGNNQGGNNQGGNNQGGNNQGGNNQGGNNQGGNNQGGSNQGGNNQGGNTSPGAKSAAPVIIGIVVAVLVIAAAVVAVIVLKKKRTPKSLDTETETESEPVDTETETESEILNTEAETETE